MDTTVVTQVLRDGIWVVIKIGGPMSVIILTLLVAGGWMGETVLDYAKEVFSLMAATR